ncbi:reverse transcriptase domain, Reverse transcriptase zinc-binding domain protein [Artemisia annua]|uniref:Reverse transcriptase domain, Reverse transcriptase zinc-binding domain protein n=1 Tax=Artemisia annua TaxID=35608 RepID=A0A2U1PYH4_ARTAN|nr:reverse transcriptase domain, Reverse transcriptase zinc-binding domain protein [Artemisia annua]
MNFLSINLRGIKDDCKARWINGLKNDHKISFICIQETHRPDERSLHPQKFWGNLSYHSDFIPSTGTEGRSGGILSIWDPSSFTLFNTIKSNHYLITSGLINGTTSPCHILNVYAPQEIPEKQSLWNEISNHIAATHGIWILLGDFNAIRYPSERENSNFNPSCAFAFNDFIHQNGLVEYTMHGGLFTYIKDNGSKQIIIGSLHSGFYLGRPDQMLNSKLKKLKKDLKEWNHNNKSLENNETITLTKQLETLDAIIDQRDYTDDEIALWTETKDKLQAIELSKTLDLQQKSRSKWVKNGDENTAFFHSFINSRKAKNRLNGLMINGNWYIDPPTIRQIAHDFFQAKFSEPIRQRPTIDCHGLKTLTPEDATFLTSPFTLNEISQAVWDCDSGKAPGPDGFNFGFIKKYWDELKFDFLNIMLDFYETGLLPGIGLPNNGPKISHFLYADDAILLGAWSATHMANTSRLLRCFHIATGLKVNLQKSIFFGINLPPEAITISTNTLNCQTGSFPITYLGLTVGSNMNLVNNWTPLIQTFENRLSLWKASTLSLGGRITLIRSVLDSLPSYFFSLYKAPVSVISKLESIRRTFFWGGSLNQRKIPWISWDKVILPKKSGGLGLGSLHEKNLSLLCKWWWRFYKEPTSLWARVVSSIHQSRRNISTIPYKSNMAGVWKSIANLNSHLSPFNVYLENLITGCVGNGASIRFWIDTWTGNTPLFKEYPELFKLETHRDCLLKDRCTNAGRISQWEWSWS